MLTYELARRMAETSEIRIYGRRLLGDRAEERIAENIEIYRVPVPMRALRLGLTLADLVRADAPIFLSPLFAGGYAKAVARDRARRPVDLVHVMNFPQFAPPDPARQCAASAVPYRPRNIFAVRISSFRSRFFVQVSVKNESFGLPVLEATAAGVPVVAARSLRRLIIGGDLRSLGWNMKVDVEGLICNLRN